MKKSILIVTLCLLPTLFANAQREERRILSKKDADMVVKTNVLYDLTATLNLGIEYQIAEKYTIDVSVNLNPWQFEDTKLQHFLLQPEVRWWNTKVFEGFFVGAHVLYANYDVGKINIPSLGMVDNIKTSYYKGYMMGAGISAGKVWSLSNKLNLEATLGVGYAYLEWDRYEKVCYKKFIEQKNKHTILPTKAGVSLVYFFQ